MPALKISIQNSGCTAAGGKYVTCVYFQITKQALYKCMYAFYRIYSADGKKKIHPAKIIIIIRQVDKIEDKKNV